MKQELKRGIFYTRTSTSGQTLDESGKRKEEPSPDIHKQRSIDEAKYLSKKTGSSYKISEFIIDEGFSGKDTNRPGFKKMCELIKRGEFDFIITVELSRLSRSVLDFLDLVALCKKYNVDLMIIGLDLNTSNAFGMAMVTILVTLAQFERETTAERVKANVIARLISTGKINGAAEVLGLVRDLERTGHFIKDEEGLKSAIKIMNLFLKLSSKAKVLQEAKRLGIKGKNGQELTSRMVDYVLENSKWRYRGLWYANKENKNLDQNSLPENQQYQIFILDNVQFIIVKFYHYLIIYFYFYYI
jgi:DNA invertase Pin-like site-specific DNA recombinase